MYSNQKDQIKLEEVYSNVHNDTINEDANETLGAAFIYGTLLIPVIIDHLIKKYPTIENNLKSIKEYLKNKISNDSSITVMKQNADEHGGEGASDYYKDLNKKIATDIQQDQKFRSNIDGDFGKSIFQDIVNLLPKNLTNKTKEQAQNELIKNINQDSINITQNQKRKQMGLPQLPQFKG
jgi:hypothetical protein